MHNVHLLDSPCRAANVTLRLFFATALMVTVTHWLIHLLVPEYVALLDVFHFSLVTNFISLLSQVLQV